MKKDREGLTRDSVNESQAELEAHPRPGQASPPAEPSEDESLEFYRKTIESLQQERDENYDLLLRKQAEFDNYRKRVVREKEDVRLASQAAVLRELLPIVDAFQRGLQSLDREKKGHSLESYREGYELMLKEFASIFEKFGVTEIPGRGTSFDPNVHEAVVREVTSEHPEGAILEEYRKGYLMRDRLLRPAQVKVAVQPDEVSITPEPGGGKVQ